MANIVIFICGASTGVLLMGFIVGATLKRADPVLATHRAANPDIELNERRSSHG